MFKIAVLGGSDTVIGFKALGLDVYPVNSDEEAGKAFKKISDPEAGYAIVYVEENYALSLENEIAKYKDSPELAVILVPGRDGSLGLGQNALKAAVERAVGSDIL